MSKPTQSVIDRLTPDEIAHIKRLEEVLLAAQELCNDDIAFYFGGGRRFREPAFVWLVDATQRADPAWKPI